MQALAGGRALLGTGQEAASHLALARPVDTGVLWGPLGGYFAQQAEPPLEVVPLVNEKGSSRMIYRITMGVPPWDQNWKCTLNEVIRDSQDEINRTWAAYGVPLLDEHPIRS